MTIETWITYVATVLALMIIPGPSQLLMLSNSLQYGFRRSTFTAFGDLTANSIQMLLAGLGLASMVVRYPSTLTTIKWLGAAYLIWLGFRTIRRAKSEAGALATTGPKTSLRKLWVQGFLTSATNPKAIIFFAALFPLFISTENPFQSQFLILSVTYLALDALFLSLYGLSAEWVLRRFQGETRLLVERVGSGFMILAALLLVAKTIAT